MKDVKVLIGNYGSGKSELALNFAMQAAARGERTELLDLDMVNTYFRLTERGKAVGRAIGEKIMRIVEAASEGLSEAERQTMYRALALVSENLERIYTHKKTAGDRAARDEQ